MVRFLLQLSYFTIDLLCAIRWSRPWWLNITVPLRLYARQGAGVTVVGVVVNTPSNIRKNMCIGHVRWARDRGTSIIRSLGPSSRALGTVAGRMLQSGGLEGVVCVVEEYVYLPSTNTVASNTTLYFLGVRFGPKLGHRPSIIIIIIKS